MTTSTPGSGVLPLDGPLSRTGLPFDQAAVEQILRTRLGKDSFGVVEDRSHVVADGMVWRRRRLAWEHAESGDPQGLCVNEIRLAPASAARIHPRVAMAAPGLVDFDAIEHAYWQTCWAGGALRSERGKRESRLFVNMRELTCARSGAPRGPWEDLHALEDHIAKGKWHDDLVDLIPALQPTVRREGDTELRVARYLPAFPASSTVQAEDRVLAATNAGYFLNFPEEYEDGVSALHQPVGALYSDGVMHMPPWIERPCAVEWIDGRRAIELLGPEDLVLTVNDGEPLPLAKGTSADASAAATVWRAFDGAMPAPVACVLSADLVFSGAGLVAVVEPGTRTPPLGGAIVRLVGEAAAPWRPWIEAPRGSAFPSWRLDLLTSRREGLLWVLASGPKLVIEGRVLDEAGIFGPLAAGEFRPNGPPPTRFPYDATKTRAPRTAIGLTRDEDWVLAVVDGRSDMAHSVGATLEELGRLMAKLGCVSAMNLDGGGSSAMTLEGVGRLDQLKPGLAQGLVNIPSDPGNRERIVPVAITIVS